MLNRPKQQRRFLGDDREQLASARQAAEALFAAKPELAEEPVSDSSQPTEAHKPRNSNYISRWLKIHKETGRQEKRLARRASAEPKL